MSKKKSETKKRIVSLGLFFAFSLFSSFLFPQLYSFAQQGPTIVAPGELSERERQKLDTEYKFQVRGKDLLLSPEFVSPGASPSTVSEAELREQTEQEKLYRYFGIASKLYDDCRLEEAIEILKYIAYKNPRDEYVNNILKKMEGELKNQQKDWKNKSAKNACLLKKKQIKDSLEEGIAFYKQKRFDWALLRFSEIQAIDPDNATAKSYLNKLKEYYSKETKAESIVKNSSVSTPDTQTKDNQDPPATANKTVTSNQKSNLTREERLDNALENLKSDSNQETIHTFTNKQNIESVITDVKTKRSAYEKDLEEKIEEIITRLKKEDERKRFLTFGPGDIVMISVRDHPELSGKTSVRLTGDIVLPLVNTPIQANGLTFEELSVSVSEAMKRYVKEPIVNLTVEEYKSKVFYFIDETSSTTYPITRANLTLRDALFLADWGPDRAVGRVLLIKPDKIAPIVKKINAYDLIYRGKLFNDVRVENGDVIYVPHTFARGVTDYINGAMALPNAVSSSGNQAGVMGRTMDIHDSVGTIKKYKVP
jgi:protein involved in polysaccharide export with SLBB domain